MKIINILPVAAFVFLSQMSALSQNQLPAIPPEEAYKDIKFIPAEPGAKPLSYAELPEAYKGYFMSPLYPVRKTLPKDWNIYRNDEKYAITFDGKSITSAQLDKYIPQTVHWQSHGLPINDEKKVRVALFSEKGFYTEFPNGYPKVTGDIPLKNYTPIVKYAYGKFPGGMEAFNKFVMVNLAIPDSHETKMRVFVKFFVDTDGAINEFKVMTKEAPEWLTPELDRIFKKSPKWTFDPKEGERKSTSYTIPVNLMGIE